MRAAVQADEPSVADGGKSASDLFQAEAVPPYPVLEPGDILLYGDSSWITPGGWLSRLIRFRTWSDVSHVEIYAGGNISMASRGAGVDLYPFRPDGLRYILRPRESYSWENGFAWFQSIRGTKYGALDLFRFYGINLPTKGLICSQFADLFFLHSDLELFNINYPSGAVCPGDFCKVSSELLEQIWGYKAGNAQLPGCVVPNQASLKSSPGGRMFPQRHD